jgi:peptidoglycan hydrolase CwlO-like protein
MGDKRIIELEGVVGIREKEYEELLNEKEMEMGEILENFTHLENDIKVLQKDLEEKEDLLEQTKRALATSETAKSGLEAALG